MTLVNDESPFARPPIFFSHSLPYTAVKLSSDAIVLIEYCIIPADPTSGFHAELRSESASHLLPAWPPVLTPPPLVPAFSATRTPDSFLPDPWALLSVLKDYNEAFCHFWTWPPPSRTRTFDSALL